MYADDVAKVLGYSNSRKALQDHVDNEDRTDGVTIRDAIGRNQKMIIINESGLYALISFHEIYFDCFTFTPCTV